MSVTIGPGITLNQGIAVMQPVMPVSSGLVQYMDAVDYSGSGTSWPARIGANGTLINAPAWSNTSGTYFTFTPASLQYALFPNIIGDLSSWTVECWFKTTASLATSEATSAVTTIYDDYNVAHYGVINYTLSNYGGGSNNPNMTAGYFNGAWDYTSGAIPNVGQWYQMVGTFDGTTLSSYWDGGLYNSVSGVGGSTANGGPIRIARRWDGPENPLYYFPGSIALVRIYNTTLNSSQVQQNYNATRTRFGL